MIPRNAYAPSILLAPDGDGPLSNGTDETSGIAPTPLASRRAGSMMLREGAGTMGAGAGLDSANQSLADALNVVYKLVIFTMIGLAIAWVMSGFRVVNEGSRGVRVLFGSIQDSNLEPGFRWSAPFPFGELISIEQGYREVPLKNEFWFFVPAGADPAPDKNTPTPSLNPDQGGSGSVLTSDGNIAHTQWRVSYNRRVVNDFSANVHPDYEVALVRAAAMRGVVSATAQYPIEPLLKQGGDAITVNDLATTASANSEPAKAATASTDPSKDEPAKDATTSAGQTAEDLAKAKAIEEAAKEEVAKARAKQGASNVVAQRARIIAQEVLDSVSSGIQINEFTLDAAIPPLFVRSDFAAVQSAVAKSNQERESAESDARRTLNEVAGDASNEILGLSTEYELAIAQLKNAEAAAILVKIDSVFQDRRRSVDGRVLEGKTSGKSAQLLDEAELYRSQVVSHGQGDLARFRAKLAQHDANPSLMVAREWTDAYAAFVSSPSVEVMLFPSTTDTVNLQLNRDPTVEREQDKARKIREQEISRKLREAQMNDARFRTQTGVPITEQ